MTQLIVSDAADLGTPQLQSLSPAPVRSHLVEPQPAPRTVQLDLRSVEARLVALERRVADLEAPGWWRQRWMRLTAWWRRFYGAA